MEVVSPPLFGRVNQGAKRRFGSPSANCSTSAVATASNTADDFDMMADDCSSSYGFQATKRRKRFSNDGIGGSGGENNNNFTFHQSKENWSLSPFVQATSSSRPLHGGAATATSNKRSRATSQQHSEAACSTQKIEELQQMVDRQGAEIQRLKSEKDSIQASATQLSTQHAKVEHENKILKRAVTIQQERGNQMNSELENARQYKIDAEERIRRLEQMNLTLQYQLQANSGPSGNDFMGGFNQRPPDVY